MANIPVQIVLRPYASALPLAAFAFGTGNALYGAYLLHWIPTTEARTLALMLLAFVAPLEIGPSVLAFLSRDTGGATAFAIFGAVWIVQGLELLGGTRSSRSHATAAFLMCLALCLMMLAVVTFKGKPLMGAILIIATVRTIGASLVALVGDGWFSGATAWCGLLLASLAFYAGFAFLEEDVTQRLSPLTFRAGEARAAMEGGLEDQVSTIEREAGIRKQL